ncbi:MAG: hypothetical protein L3J36_00745 [Rhodobacteraceae bacterium]|nr:hypothetical protein [Paracoccaceae bacterium]
MRTKLHLLTSALILGVVAACSPAIPDSGAEAGASGGVGFNNSFEAQQAREAALNTGQPLVPPTVLSDETITPAPLPLTPTVRPLPLPAAAGRTSTSTPAGSSDDIAAETAAALAAVSSNSGQAPLLASPSNPAPQNNIAISDENDFDAVSERQTIASDAERIARNREQYQVITPTSVPIRGTSTQPNIVEYALSTSNPRGTSVYSRSGFNGASKSARNCARFASPDQAQTAFLSQGGPQRDRKGLDPDGDGYACTWDPAPFRKAAGN